MSREEFLVPFEINTDFIESKLNEDAAEIVKENVTRRFYGEVNNIIDGYFSREHGWGSAPSDTYIEKKIEDEIVNKSVDRLVTLISKRKAMKDKYGSLLDGE